jgi:gliding motility-associated protein GldC
MAIKHVSNITIEVGMDENRVPEEIKWSASDGGIANEPSDSLMLSFWDANAQETLRIDLWTKTMPLNEMKRFYQQTFLSMADSYLRATNDEELADQMRQFADYMAEKIQEKE